MVLLSALFFRELSVLDFIRLWEAGYGADSAVRLQQFWDFFKNSNPGSGSQLMADNASPAVTVQPIVKWELMYEFMHNEDKILYALRVSAAEFVQRYARAEF